MADPKFFTRAGPFTVEQLAEIGECELVTPGLAARSIADTGTLSDAGADAITFLDNSKYAGLLPTTGAGACVLHPRDRESAPAGLALLETKSPYRSFALITQALYPAPPSTSEIHPGAHVDPTARLGANCQVDAGAVIDAGAVLGNRVIVGANAVIAGHVEVGDDVRIGPNASLEFCHIGQRTQIHAGARIGTRGFGFAMDARGHVELPQLGRVIIGEDVEIGANTTVDRGMGPDTTIGDGTKIDNLVQIAHNVQIGRSCVIAALGGVAGSTKFQDFVLAGAMVGVAGHVTIGAGARLAAMTGITKSVPPGATMAGMPGIGHKDWLKLNALFSRMLKKQKEGRDE